ncbi:hypothetical protein CEXT_546791 [Caerostris extrusa]|uniref:Uncharacterized protein n=1 Tax=Caerostris extrusa TaxID=172846 RepID=A0AAV4YAK0_CAEEX|nr:hypothetical protein CEXT_546791 [Caerostris extrusa]
MVFDGGSVEKGEINGGKGEEQISPLLQASGDFPPPFAQYGARWGSVGKGEINGEKGEEQISPLLQASGSFHGTMEWLYGSTQAAGKREKSIGWGVANLSAVPEIYRSIQI